VSGTNKTGVAMEGGGEMERPKGGVNEERGKKKKKARRDGKKVGASNLPGGIEFASPLRHYGTQWWDQSNNNSGNGQKKEGETRGLAAQRRLKGKDNLESEKIPRPEILGVSGKGLNKEGGYGTSGERGDAATKTYTP